MIKERSNTRRYFSKKAVTMGTMVAIIPHLSKAIPVVDHTSDASGTDHTILFQGDSITDGNRTRNNDWNHLMGHGYAYLIASRLWHDYPKHGFHFFNRGISGNKVTGLAARWKQDTLEIKPTMLSILIGINDTAIWVYGNKDYSVSQYESGYRSLLQLTKQQLPNVELVLCEPFILPVGKVKEKWEDYFEEVQRRQQMVQRLSEEFDAIFVGFQSIFNKALSKAPADYWIWDGIHPMPAG
ncbi:MAG: SGNH/GDSL hydrolase family protein, partial [Chitinophagaceae bacterium]|nr:SGNH/GDSL hydrolase family protein [Chitinophagaceae bacterium]